MDALREVGLKAVIRFAYNFNANDLDDAPKNRVLEHITQLKPYLEENYDVIAFMEAGFIGKWAEWHGSSNNLLGGEWSFDVNQNTRDIYAALMDALPSYRMMAFRYIPQIQDLLNQTTCENNSGVFHEFSESIAFSGSDRARTGRQDDWFFGNNGSNSGTWSGNSAIRECQKDYLEELSKYVPISTGETQEFSDYSKNTSPIADLKRFHYASLSMNPGNEGQTLINHWKSNGIYNEMAKRFGYRLSLITSTAPTQLANNGTLSLSIKIKNDGFGTPYNPRLFEVILRNQSTGTLFKYDITNQDGNNLDPRWWFWENGQMSKNINISVGDIPKGKYDVLLHLPDPAPKLYGRPEYSIRLANENTWEASTGFNKLNHTITVDGNNPNEPVSGNGTGLAAEYFNNTTLSGNTALTRTDASIDFNWGNGSPNSQITNDNFSVRWTGQVEPQCSETYTFETETDDGVRLWVNEMLLVDKWQDMAPHKFSGTIALEAGEKYSIKMEYYENAIGAVAKLRWSSASQTYQIIPKTQLYPATVSSGVFQQSSSGLVEIEVENYHSNLAQGSHEWVETNPTGFSGTAALTTTPNSGTNNNTGYQSNSPRLDYQVNFVKTGTHYIWTRGIGSNGNDDSYHAGFDGNVSTTSDRISSFGSSWTWSKQTMDGTVASFNVGSTGQHTFNIWMREDGFVIDKVIITNNASYTPNTSSAKVANTMAQEGNALNLSLYPNPVTNILTLEGTDVTGATVQITNTIGQIVLKKTLTQPTLDFSDFANGIYIISIEKEGQVIKRKVFKR